MSANDGGPAFPLQGFLSPEPIADWPCKGMTLRDYFAATALNMSGVIATAHDYDNPDIVADRVARWSYVLADAMLKERAK